METALNTRRKKTTQSVAEVCQTNGAGPSGEEIITGSVSVKHGNTKPNKGRPKGGEGAPRRRCSSLRGSRHSNTGPDQKCL